MRLTYREAYSFNFYITKGRPPFSKLVSLTSGSGYIPLSAVTGNTNSGLKIKFNSADLPIGDYRTMDDVPVMVDVKLNKRGDIIEKVTGTRVVERNGVKTRTHGTSETGTAVMAGEIFGVMIEGDFYGQFGVNRNMSVAIEYAPKK